MGRDYARLSTASTVGDNATGTAAWKCARPRHPGKVTKQRRIYTSFVRSRQKCSTSNRQLYENLEFPEQKRTGGSRFVGRCVGPGNRLCERPCHLCAAGLSGYRPGT